MNGRSLYRVYIPIFSCPLAKSRGLLSAKCTGYFMTRFELTEGRETPSETAGHSPVSGWLVGREVDRARDVHIS